MAEREVEIYLEVGKKRALAVALEWPGWARAGTDEVTAQQALLAYAPRYGEVLAQSGIAFQPAASLHEFAVVERLEGGSGTDFGVPGLIPAADARPVDAAELARLQTILRACWNALDAAAAAARGKTLRLGARGGGRDLDKIVSHVAEAEASAYAGAAGWKLKLDPNADAAQHLAQAHQGILDAMAAFMRGEIAPLGPRGGKRWPPRYLARRAAWHVLDHTWEILDRVES